MKEVVVWGRGTLEMVGTEDFSKGERKGGRRGTKIRRVVIDKFPKHSGTTRDILPLGLGSHRGVSHPSSI